MLKYCILICLLLIQFCNCFDYDGWLNIKMQHSLRCDNEQYCTRGSVALKSLRSGTAVIEQLQLTNEHIQELKELANMDEFYTIKTFVSSADSKEVEFLSSMKAQAFLDSGLSDVINVLMMPTGAVVAVSFQVGNLSETNSYTSTNYDIKSKFYLQHVDQAPVPDTASYIQKLEREREAREKGEVKDNRSFIAKYWMYIVPVAIFVMISGATNPEPAQPSGR